MQEMPPPSPGVTPGAKISKLTDVDIPSKSHSKYKFQNTYSKGLSVQSTSNLKKAHPCGFGLRNSLFSEGVQVEKTIPIMSSAFSLPCLLRNLKITVHSIWMKELSGLLFCRGFLARTLCQRKTKFVKRAGYPS